MLCIGLGSFLWIRISTVQYTFKLRPEEPASLSMEISTVSIPCTLGVCIVSAAQVGLKRAWPCCRRCCVSWDRHKGRLAAFSCSRGEAGLCSFQCPRLRLLCRCRCSGDGPRRDAGSRSLFLDEGGAAGDTPKCRACRTTGVALLSWDDLLSLLVRDEKC